MSRDFCPRCAVKHLAQARALMKETKKGYPHHVWYAVGHMAEAEDEITDLMPGEANLIREARLKLEWGLASGKVEMPDWRGLMETVAKGGMLEEMQSDVVVVHDLKFSRWRRFWIKLGLWLWGHRTPEVQSGLAQWKAIDPASPAPNTFVYKWQVESINGAPTLTCELLPDSNRETV